MKSLPIARGWRRTALLLTPVFAGCSSNFGMTRPASEQGDQTAQLWRIFVITAIAVGALVWGLILWAVIRYRRRSEELPRQTFLNVPLEIGYTVLPLLLVGFLFAATLRTTSKVNDLVENPDLVVEVTGFQWQWRFVYPGTGVEVVGETGKPAVMVLPVGATVRIVLSSADVIHSFWVPEFVVKRDAIPNRKTEFDIKVTRAGTYDTGRCVEYCGLDHAGMTFVVRVVSRAQFDSWLSGRARVPA